MIMLVKVLIMNFIHDAPLLSIKSNIYYIHNSSEEGGYIFSLITLLVNVNVSSIPISTFCTCVLYTTFFAVLKPKEDSSIKIFIENQRPVKTNQTHGFVTICPMTCLPV